ncbi:permease [Reinekea blandensis]|nr:permease [Reinekea blandensis]
MNQSLKDALVFFVGTFAELAVLFLLVSFLVGLVQYKFPRARVKALLAGQRGYAVAILLGAVTPFCSCSSLPMTAGLIQARAPFGPVMAFLFTSPLLNPFIVVLFLSVFGLPMLLIYTLFVLVSAVVSGFLLQTFRFERFVRADLYEMSHAGIIHEYDNQGLPWRRVLNEASRQFVSFLPYMALGVGVGAVVHGFVPEAFFTRLSSPEAWWLVPVAALIGIVLYVRASTMVPIAASLVAKGMSLGSVMSLTIGGAGASLPELIMLRRMFRAPLMAAFIVLVFSTASLTGYTVNLMDLGGDYVSTAQQ